MSKEHRVTRKEILKTPDQFLTFSERVVHYWADRQPTLVAIGVGLMLIVFAVVGIETMQDSNAEAQETLLLKMSESRIPDKKDSTKASIDELKKIYDQVDSGVYKHRAGLILADAFFEEKKYDESEKLYRSILAETQQGDTQYQVAKVGVASSLEGKKEYKKAIETYRSLVDDPASAAFMEVYFSLARCYELDGDTQGALMVLRQMQNKFQGRAQLSRVDQRIQALEKTEG
jgi:predicted negative regulator of RcsB-dependent stress response